MERKQQFYYEEKNAAYQGSGNFIKKRKKAENQVKEITPQQSSNIAHEVNLPLSPDSYELLHPKMEVKKAGSLDFDDKDEFRVSSIIIAELKQNPNSYYCDSDCPRLSYKLPSFKSIEGRRRRRHASEKSILLGVCCNFRVNPGNRRKWSEELDLRIGLARSR